MADAKNTSVSNLTLPDIPNKTLPPEPAKRLSQRLLSQRQKKILSRQLQQIRHLRTKITDLRKRDQRLSDDNNLTGAHFLILPDPVLIWQKDENGDIRLTHFNQASIEMSEGNIHHFKGMTIDDFFNHAPNIAELIRDTLNTGFSNRIETPYIMRTTGKEKWIVADYVRISDTHLLNIVRDITSQKRRQQVDEAERSKIELLRQAMAAFTSVMNLNHVLKQVMEYLKLLIPYDRALLYLLDKNELEIAAAGGFGDNSPLIGRRIPTRNPQFEAINRNRYPLYLNNAETYRPFQELGDLNCGKAWLGVPLLGHGQLIGYLSIYSASSGLYGGNETDLAQTFANEAAIAIENARLFQQVMQFAITDSLTGFYNRRYFYELAEIELRRSRRYRSDLSLMMIDIDFFKQVNDRLGHTMGDQVLVQLSECLRAQIRDSDSIGRYGGEEFVILMPETNLNQAAEAAERLRRAIEICSTIVDHSEVQVTISLGIAQMDETCANIDDLFRRADRALYHAKQTGRNRVCVWSETMGV